MNDSFCEGRVGFNVPRGGRCVLVVRASLQSHYGTGTEIASGSGTATAANPQIETVPLAFSFLLSDVAEQTETAKMYRGPPKKKHIIIKECKSVKLGGIYIYIGGIYSHIG